MLDQILTLLTQEKELETDQKNEIVALLEEPNNVFQIYEMLRQEKYLPKTILDIAAYHDLAPIMNIALDKANENEILEFLQEPDNYIKTQQLLKTLRTTILHIGANKNSDQIIKLALESGNEDEDTISCFLNKPENYIKINEILQTQYDSTILHFAACNGLEQIVKLALKNGAHVNTTDDNGMTPLHKACESGCYEIVDFLIKHGADVNAKASIIVEANEEITDYTPLHCATMHRNYKIVALLIKAGANPDIINSFMDSSMYNAFFNNDLESILILYQADASIYIINRDGETPLDNLNCLSKFNSIFMKMAELSKNPNPYFSFNHLKEFYILLIQPAFDNLVQEIKVSTKTLHSLFLLTATEDCDNKSMLLDLLASYDLNLIKKITHSSEEQAASYLKLVLDQMPQELFNTKCNEILAQSFSLQEMAENAMCDYETSLALLSNNNNNIDTAAMMLENLHFIGEDDRYLDEH